MPLALPPRPRRRATTLIFLPLFLPSLPARPAERSFSFAVRFCLRSAEFSCRRSLIRLSVSLASFREAAPVTPTALVSAFDSPSAPPFLLKFDSIMRNLVYIRVIVSCCSLHLRFSSWCASLSSRYLFSHFSAFDMEDMAKGG